MRLELLGCGKLLLLTAASYTSIFIVAPSPSLIVKAHTRLECPPSRSVETGQKVGPCDAPDNLDLAPFPLEPNALSTITWLESISHPGAPARLALSLDGSDEGFESCLLLDHIPHDEYSLPIFPNQLTWHRSAITVWIPDVYCERCNLQLLTIMSDEAHGVPFETTCAYGAALAAGTVSNASLPACPVVYHSCAPVSINGTIPRNNITQCDTKAFEQKLEWPFMDLATQGPQGDKKPQYSTYYYKGNPGTYNYSNSVLQVGGSPIRGGCDSLSFCNPEIYFDPVVSVPPEAPYVQLRGGCAPVVATLVTDFILGQLPTQPKNMSTLRPEITPCTPCKSSAFCFFFGCAGRDRDTGLWSDQAAVCNSFAGPCEFCYPDSPCYLLDQKDQQDDNDNETPAPAPAPLPPTTAVPLETANGIPTTTTSAPSLATVQIANSPPTSSGSQTSAFVVCATSSWQKSSLLLVTMLLETCMG